MSVDTRTSDAYLACALWADLNDEKGEPLKGYTVFDFAKESRDKAREELEEFIAAAGEMLDGWDAEQVGHDFWLTRNGHGAGFWDRGLPFGRELTDLCKTYGARSCFLGDDGKVYIE